MSEKLYNEISLIEPIWDNVPSGTKFKATIYNTPLEGRIYKENGNIFLCQDVHSGQAGKTKLGYKFSWGVDSGAVDNLRRNDVTILELELDPEFTFELPPPPPPPFEVGDYTATFEVGFITVGCQRIPNEKVREVASMLIDEKEGK